MARYPMTHPMTRPIFALALLMISAQLATAQEVPLVWGGQTDPVILRGRECRVRDGMVNFFHPSDPLYRHTLSLLPRVLRDDVNVLAGHGGPGGGCGWREYTPDFAHYDGRHCTAAQRAELLGMYNYEANRAGRNPIGLQLNCYSGMPGNLDPDRSDGRVPSMAERAAGCLATRSRNSPGMYNLQIGMVGEVALPRCGGNAQLAQRNPLLGNPRGLILYYGIPLRDGTSAVEAVYVPDGSRVLENLSRNPDRPITFAPWQQDDEMGMGTGRCRPPSWASSIGNRLRMCDPNQVGGGLQQMGQYGPLALAGGGLTLDGVGRCLNDDPSGIPEAALGTTVFTAGGSLTLYGGANVATGLGFYGTGATLSGGGTALASACLPATACVAVGTTFYCGTRAVDNASGGRISDGVATGLCAVGDTFANVCWRWWAPGCEWNYDLTSSSAGMYGENARRTLRGPAPRCGGGAVRPAAVDPPYEGGEDGDGDEAAGCTAGQGAGAASSGVLLGLALLLLRRRATREGARP